MPQHLTTKKEFIDLIASIKPDSRGCKIWPRGLDADGYPRIRVEGFKGRRGHRMVLELRLGRDIAEGLLACHHCDVRSCVEESHLYEGTPLQNGTDAKVRGRMPSGDNNPTRKYHKNPLSRIEDLVAIRWRRFYGESSRSISRDYGISSSTVRRVMQDREPFRTIMRNGLLAGDIPG